jgi:hypothetical protein
VNGQALLDQPVPAMVSRELLIVKHDAERVHDLVRSPDGRGVDEACTLLESAGARMAEAASHPGVPATTARQLLRARDTVDAHLLAAGSLNELAMVDDARRLLLRAANVIISSFDSDAAATG